jgi:hypothetical protein
LPQPLQLAGSDDVSVSQPLSLLPSQSAVPFGQTQTPPAHSSPKPQMIEQLPQLLGSTAAFTSQPSATFLLQSM